MREVTQNFFPKQETTRQSRCGETIKIGVRKMKSEKWNKRGFEITSLRIDISDQKNQIDTIKDLAPCFGLDTDMAIMQMWTNYGFERGVKILCEALLLETENEQDISLANSEDEEFQDGDAWQEHLEDLAEYNFGEDFIREHIFSWNRNYQLGNTFYSFFNTDDEDDDEDDYDEYEILIQNTRIGLRVGRFD